MNNPTTRKLVQFGAGKIGRALIGQLFSKSGYDVVFIDISEGIIEAINYQKSYVVIHRSNDIEEFVQVENIWGVHLSDAEKIVDEIAHSDIVATSVGPSALSDLFPLISKGLEKRFEANPKQPLDIIIAENLRNASDYFRIELKRLLPLDYPLDSLVGIVETSIGKMVPLQSSEEIPKSILDVIAEPYNKLIADKSAFKNGIPNVNGLELKENIKAWVDRKLFIHNLGHVTAAYLGFWAYPQKKFIYEVLQDESVFFQVRETMIESARILRAVYSGEFTEDELLAHIDDLLNRFRNVVLGDTIYRVGCDLTRKLGRDDRLVGVAVLGVRYSLPISKIVKAICLGFHFRATDAYGQLHPNDKKFHEMIQEKGFLKMLKLVCGLNSKNDQLLIYYLLKTQSELKHSYTKSNNVMKRSEINQIMENGLHFIEKDMHFPLPPFAKWSPDEWSSKGEESVEIVEQQLGWDITDFGSGNFEKVGLLLFTIRNGSFEELKKPNGKIYAEKAMIVLEEQVTPIHFHYQKMEDIINRGGGDLVIQLWNSLPNQELDLENDVTVSVDGVKVKVKPGGTITLTPGESVCLPQKLYHKFWGKKGKGTVFVGEVSRVNDDYVDNHFYEKVGRFADIEENVMPKFLLYSDYQNFLKI